MKKWMYIIAGTLVISGTAMANCGNEGCAPAKAADKAACSMKKAGDKAACDLKKAEDKAACETKCAKDKAACSLKDAKKCCGTGDACCKADKASDKAQETRKKWWKLWGE